MPDEETRTPTATSSRRDWTRCAWCWKPLVDVAGAVVWRRDAPHCSEACASHELVGGAEPGSPAEPFPDAQLELEVGG